MILNRASCSKAFCRMSANVGYLRLRNGRGRAWIRAIATICRAAGYESQDIRIEDGGNVCQKETQEGRKITQYILYTRD